MNKIETFLKKLDEVFELMLCGKLQKDIDDALLEKLLGVIKEGYHRRSVESKDLSKKKRYDPFMEQIVFLKDLLKRTTISTFLGKAFSLLQDSGEMHCSPSDTFALHLLGLFSEHQDIFLMLKDKQELLPSLSDILRKNSLTPYSPSVQAAMLSCFTSIAQHPEGISWLVEQGVIDIAFSSFYGSSYYVRKDAVNFFATVLLTWSSLENLYAKRSADDCVNTAVNGLIEHLISGLQYPVDPEKQQAATECCISVLRVTMEKSVTMQRLLCEKFHLPEKITKSLQFSVKEVEPPENIIELLVESLSCSQPSNSAIVTEVIQLFLQHEFVASVIILLSSLLLRQYSTEQSLGKDQLSLVMWPLVKMSNIRVSCIPPEEFSHMLECQMANKDICRRLVRMSLAAVSKLLHLMDVETLTCIVNASTEVLKNTLSKQALSPMQLNIAGYKKVQMSTLQLFCALLEEPVYQNLAKDMVTLLMDSLITTLETPTTDNNLTSQALKLISRLLSLQDHPEDILPRELRKKLAGMIQRKLLDTRWPVVDSSLEVVGQMVKGCRDDELWQEWICSYNIHTSVWDVAASNIAEGYVRATALRVLISLCFCAHIWEQLKSQRGADEDAVVSALCKLSSDPDVFVQRESVSSLFQWMQTSNVSVPSTNSTAIFKTLTAAVRYSLDWDTKLIALRAWQWLAEKELSCFSSPTQNSNVQETLHLLCNIGYGSSILSALSDHDRTVQHEAAQALFSLRQTLLELGLNETSLQSKTVKFSTDNQTPERSEHGVMTSSCNSDLWDYSSDQKMKPVSQAERDAAIEDVLNLDTLGQIHKVLRTTDNAFSMQQCPPLYCSSFASSDIEVTPVNTAKTLVSCSIEIFWKNLWSDEIESILTLSSRSSDVYANDPVALLDDILAARRQDLLMAVSEFQVTFYIVLGTFFVENVAIFFGKSESVQRVLEYKRVNMY